MRGSCATRVLGLGLCTVVAGCGASSSDHPSSASAGSAGTSAAIGGSGGGIPASGGNGNAKTGGTGGATGGSNSTTGGTSTGGTTTGGATSNSGGAGGSVSVNNGCVSVTATATPSFLQKGVWTDISPSAEGGESMSCIAIDPSNPSTIYAGINWKGLWKTTDGGQSWSHVGADSDPNPYDRTTSYFDDASSIAVDPKDPSHLYLTKGVDGNDLGFWVTTDGGQNWTMPAGFPPPNTTTDVTAMAVDPCDFKHILVGSHGWWGTATAGIMESTDGGTTWIAHSPTKFSTGSLGIGFLYDPVHGLGDSKTWLVIVDAFWRTTDSGVSWTKVSDSGGVHGSAETYRASNGYLFSGGWPHPDRSTDNGLTWQTLTDGIPNSAYYTIGGDGENVYVMPDGYPPGQGYLTSPESDGLHWTPYSDHTIPKRGPLQLRFDAVNGILYSVNWEAGLWALRVR